MLKQKKIIWTESSEIIDLKNQLDRPRMQVKNGLKKGYRIKLKKIIFCLISNLRRIVSKTLLDKKLK